EVIEQEATDSPQRVLDALSNRGTNDLQGAARLLAALAEETLTPERSLIMTSLMTIVSRLGDDAAAVSREVSATIRTYWVGNGELQPDHLVGALRIGL